MADNKDGPPPVAAAPAKNPPPAGDAQGAGEAAEKKPPRFGPDNPHPPHQQLSKDAEPRVVTEVPHRTIEQADRLRCRQNGTNYREFDGSVTKPSQIDDSGNRAEPKKK